MKGKMKRTLSAILAIAMLISLLPAIALAEPAENIVLNFNSTTVTPGTAAASAWVVSTDAGWTVDTVLSRTTNFVRQAVGDGYLTVSLRRSSSGYEPWQVFGATSSSNNTKALSATFAVRVPNITEGWYRVKYTGGKSSAGGRNFVYVDEQLAGVYDSYDATATTTTVGEEEIFNTLYLTPDADGSVSIRFNGAEDAANKRTDCIISKIVLEPLGTEKPASAKVKSVNVVAPKKIVPGVAANVSVNVEMEDGSFRYINGIKRMETGTLTSCSTKDTSNLINVSVSGGTLDIPFKSATAHTINGVFTSDGGAVEGSFLADVSGNYTVTVSGKINGEDISGEKILTVEETGEQEKLVLKFNKNTIEEINKVAPADWVVGANSGWTVDADNSCEIAYITTRTFVYDDAITLGMSQNSTNWTPWHQFTAGTNNNSKARRVTFTAKTSADITEGYYTVMLRGAKIKDGGRFFIYVDEQLAGVYDSNGESATPVADAEFTTLNTLLLTPETDAEDPYVRVRIVNAEPMENNRTISAFSEIELVPQGEAAPASAKVKEAVITAPAGAYVNEPVSIGAYLEMEDGSKRYFNGLIGNGGTYPFCAKIDNNNYFNITVSEGAEFTPAYSNAVASLVNGVFTGVGGDATGSFVAANAGTYTITVSGKIGGEDFTAEKTLAVEAVAEQQDLSLKFNKAAVPAIKGVLPGEWAVSGTAGWVVDPAFSCEQAYNNGTTEIYDDAMVLGLRFNSSTLNPWWYYSTGTNNNVKARRATFTVNTTDRITEGYYTVKIRGAKFAAGGKFMIYVNGQFAGTYDSYDPATETVKADSEFTTLNTLHITPRTDKTSPYAEIKIVLAEPTESGRPSAAFSEIVLETKGETAPEAVAFKAVGGEAPEKVFVGRTVPVSFYAEMTDGSYRHFNGLKHAAEPYQFNKTADKDNFITVTAPEGVTFTPDFTSGSEIFTDADGMVHGTFRADAAGEYVITVSGKIGGVEFSGEKKITAEAPPVRKTVAVNFNNATLSNLEGAPAEWVINDNGFYVDPSVSRTTKFSYSVYENMLSLALNGTSSNKNPWWMFSNTSSNNNINAKKSILAVKVKDVYEGYYRVKVTGGKVTTGARYFVYVDEQFAGTYDSYSHDTTTTVPVLGEEATFNTIYISPEIDANGASVAQIRINLAEPAGNGRHTGVLSSVTLEPVDVASEFGKVRVECDEKLVAGADLNLKVYVDMADGSIRHINGIVSDFATEKYMACSKKDANNYINITSSANATYTPAFLSTTTATINGLFSEMDGAYEGILYAEDEGNVTLTVSGKIDGKEFSEEKVLEIAPAPRLNKVEVTPDKYDIPSTRTAITSLVLTREDGSPYKDAYTVAYKSSDESIATVDENGVVTGVGEGDVVITATVSGKYDAVVSGSCEIRITEAPNLSSIKASAKKPKLIVGSTTEVAIEGTMSDGLETNLDAYNFVYESLNPDIVSIDENGLATALAIGNAMILVRTKNERGIEVSTTLRLDVYDDIPATVIDFKKTETNGTSYPPKSTAGYTIIEEKSATSTYRKDTYPEIKKKLLRVATRGSSNRFWPNASAGKGCMFTIEVYVPFESDYQLTFEGGMNYCGGMYSIFADDVYLGDYNCYAEGDGWRVGENKQLNTVHLTEGNHEISFRVRWSDYSTPYLMLNTLTLQPVDGNTEIAEIAISEVPAIMAVGEKFSDKVIAQMSDGSAYHFGVTAEGSEDTVNTISASVDGDAIEFSDFVPYTIGQSGYNDYTITAAKAGEATLTFTANVGGKTVTKTVTVKVEEDSIKETTASPEAEELFVGDSSYIIPKTTLESGRIINNASTTNVYTSETPEIVTVEGDVLTTHAIGTGRIKVETSFNGKTVTGYFDIEVLPEGMTEIVVTAGGSPRIRWTDKEVANIEDYLVPMYVQAISNEGRELDMTDAEITAEALTPEFATVDVNGIITPVYADPELGSDARFSVTVKLDGRIRTVEATLPVLCAKTQSSFYTPEETAAVRANYDKYDWVRKTADSQFAAAEKYFEHLDTLYMMIPSEGIPRGTHVGSNNDPEALICRYCGIDLLNEFGGNPWKHSPFTRPWKIQCPACQRTFPTNDFGKFYELGLNEYREFNRIRALEAHHRMIHHGDKDAECSCVSPTDEFTREWLEYYGYGAEGGYLTNNSYSNLENVSSINAGKGLREGETTATWGVDDGMGYIPRKPDGSGFAYDNGCIERHTYIAEYMHSGVWRKMSDANGGVILEAIKRGSNAYYYTGEVKYGRMAAILLDRVGDFYSQYDIGQYKNLVQNSHGGAQKGNIVGRIWDCGQSSTLLSAYDMVYDLYDDPVVINYINEKSQTIKMRYSKETGNQIRQNIEDGMVRNMLDSLVTCDLYGNFGYPQNVNARGAVVLDCMPETKYWLDYLMAAGHSSAAPSLGGGVYEHLVNEVDADGQGDEGSSYNTIWVGNLVSLNENLEDYKKYQAANFYNHPKFVRMLYSNIEMSAGVYTPNVGDSSSTATRDHWLSSEVAMNAWKNLRDPIFAQMLYMLNGNKSKGLHYGETDSDPNRLEKEVQEVIDEYGTWKPESHAMTTFAFGVLHDGGDYTSATAPTAQDTRRNVWMWWGSSNSHGHSDAMNLGMTAYGLNFMPELAYPEQTSTQPNRLQWVGTTLSHNTVMVDRKVQAKDNEYRGKLLHFEDAGAVGVMDVESENVYASADSYRRSLVYIKVNDEVSYAVDFFRVLGGWSHLYSFHAQSNEITEIKGFGECTPQVDENGNYVGSYAGADVPFGPDPNSPAEWTYETVYPRGYTWLENIDRYNNPTAKLEANFKITDFRKYLRDSSGLNLYMTMLNGTNMEKGAKVDVSIVDGYPPRKAENKAIDKLKYLLIRNEGPEGGKLDTTFTTVFEPYRNKRYVESVDELAMTVVAGRPVSTDAARAVKVKHVDGRIDYILYSTNNTVTYEIEMEDGEKLAFRGFIGVYTMQNGKNSYKYLSDGDILGEQTNEQFEVKGVVRSFTKEIGDFGINPDFTNEITVVPNDPVSDEILEKLKGRYLIVDNGAKGRSGSYEIKGVKRNGENIVFDVGLVTSIRGYIDPLDPDQGFNYTISEGQSARIPLSYLEDNAPEFDPISENLATTVGSLINIKLNATSALDEKITYQSLLLPRGATFDPETATVSWKPTSSQIGENHFAISAVDESGRESSIHFYVSVFGSTTGTVGTGNSAGAGVGGGTTKPQTPSKPEEPEKPETPEEPETPEVEEKTFTDLGNHAWAVDAINALAEEGIIKGTSATTFSPANNITRADFALLLVRAFKLESDNAENFADISAEDYFASEVAIARNNGIINGIGDNKFAPRNTITRQDMMTIVYRAMLKLGVELKKTTDAEMPDADSVAEYAKEAVDALIGAGLVNGKSGKIAPNDYTTRAEVAVLLKRILDYIA